mgnify:CR=1 FL=1
MDEQYKNLKFEITDDMLLHAETYVSIAEKAAFAKLVSEECIEEYEMSVDKIRGDSVLALPSLYREKPMIKQIYLMYFFLTKYLKIELSDEFGAQEYDKFASFHPMNQLERAKRNATISQKVYDILDDFKDMKKMLDIEIYNELQCRNEPIGRILAGVSLISSPETVEKIVTQINDLAKEANEAEKKVAQRKNAKSGQTKATKGKKLPDKTDKKTEEKATEKQDK